MPHVSVCQPSPVGSIQQSSVKVDIDCGHVDESDECSGLMSGGIVGTVSWRVDVVLGVGS